MVTLRLGETAGFNSIICTADCNRAAFNGLQSIFEFYHIIRSAENNDQRLARKVVRGLPYVFDCRRVCVSGCILSSVESGHISSGIDLIGRNNLEVCSL